MYKKKISFVSNLRPIAEEFKPDKVAIIDPTEINNAIASYHVELIEQHSFVLTRFLIKRLRELNEQNKIPNIEALNTIKKAISDIKQAIKEKNDSISLSNETKELFEVSPLTQELTETAVIDKMMLFEIINATLVGFCSKLVYFITHGIKNSTNYRRIISIRDHSLSLEICKWINEFKHYEKENRAALETKVPSKDKVISSTFHEQSRRRNTEIRLQLLAEQEKNREEIKGPVENIIAP